MFHTQAVCQTCRILCATPSGSRLDRTGQASGPTERYGPQSRVRIVQAKAIILKNEAIPGCIRHNRWRSLLYSRHPTIVSVTEGRHTLTYRGCREMTPHCPVRCWARELDQVYRRCIRDT